MFSPGVQLSEVSKNIVKNLDNDLKIKVFFTPGLPAPYDSNGIYLKSLLEEYRSNSNNKLSFDFIDTPDNSVGATEAEKYGIIPVQIQSYKKNEAEVVKAYMGMVFIYGGKHETIEIIAKIENLEYDISSKINKITQTRHKKIGVLTGDKLFSISKISKAVQSLSDYYEIVSVETSTGEQISNDIQVLLVFSPKIQQNDLKQSQVNFMFQDAIKLAVDQYIMSGGKAVFLLSKVSVQNQQNFQIAQNVTTGIEDMLESYGAIIKNNIITDKECALVSVPIQTEPYTKYTQVPFPYYPKVLLINRDIAPFASLTQVFLGFTSSIDISAIKISGIKATPLLTTSSKSGDYSELAVVQLSGKNLNDTMFKKSNLVVGAIYEGKFPSYFTGKQTNVSRGHLKSESPETKIVLIGNNEFIQDEFYGPNENFDFFNSLIDYMSDDSGLSLIKQYNTK